MAGMMDIFNNPETQQGLMGMAQGLLQAGGPSRMPVSFGQALGQGFQGFQQGQEKAEDRALKKLLLQIQMKQAMAKQYQSVKPGEKLYDITTGQVAMDGGPERMTPYQEAMLGLSRERLKRGDGSIDPETGDIIPGNNSFKHANTLRDEFNSQTKDFRTVQDAYSKIKKTSGTGAGDMSMLYQYVKLLDPGSVVRESEFATAAASGSLGERVQGAAKSIIEGGRLPPSLRNEFLAEAENVYQGQKSGYDRQKSNYTGLSKKFRIDPSLVITDYTDMSQEPVAGAQGETQPVNLFKKTKSGIKYQVIP